LSWTVILSALEGDVLTERTAHLMAALDGAPVSISGSTVMLAMRVRRSRLRSRAGWW
jgi:hypothetical protein